MSIAAPAWFGLPFGHAPWAPSHGPFRRPAPTTAPSPPARPTCEEPPVLEPASPTGHGIRRGPGAVPIEPEAPISPHRSATARPARGPPARAVVAAPDSPTSGSSGGGRRP